MFDGFSYLLGKKAGGGSATSGTQKYIRILYCHDTYGAGGYFLSNYIPIPAILAENPNEYVPFIGVFSGYMDGGTSTGMLRFDNLYRNIVCNHPSPLSMTVFGMFTGGNGEGHDYTTGKYVNTQYIDNATFVKYIDTYAPNVPEGEAVFSVFEYPSTEPIRFTFTVNGTEYKALNGMTWREWCSSSYSQDMFYCDGVGNVLDDSEYPVRDPDGDLVMDHDVIVDGMQYHTM